LIVGLLTGGLIASGATAVGARPHKPPKVTLTARVSPGAVPVGEPATLTVRLRPAVRGARLVVQQRTGTRWKTLARPRTDPDGNARVRLKTTAVGTQRLRVLRNSAHRNRRAISRPVRLTVSAAAPGCTPRPALSDPQASPAARCLAARIDRWQAAGAMGVGQQLNVSNSGYLAPVTALGGRPVKVVGFDLQELGEGETYQFPDPPLGRLVALARAGAVLSASWHPVNPRTGGYYGDRSWHDLGALLDDSTPEYARFWADYAAKIELLRRLQDAGVAVVLRPLHEANGDWFWWGHPDPATYRKVWALLQQKTWAAGVHNVVWAYSFNAVTGDNTTDPVRLLPDKIDLAGLDAYDDESSNPRDQLPVRGYDAVAARVNRMAITEAGPHNSADGSWDPAVITRAARTLSTPPAWSLLWFDDGTGKKQISSLRRGPAWLASCRGGFCDVGP
jgi:hypothetical protein